MGKWTKILGLQACGLVARLRPPGGVPVLAYHSVDDSGSYLSTRPDLFAVEMERLAARGARGISMAALMALVEAGRPVPPGQVAITFDDGLRNFGEAAWPVLRRLGFGATLYVPTAFVGGAASWYADYQLKPLPMLAWDDLRRLRDDGADIQCHGHAHRHLTRLTPAERDDDLQRSRDLMQTQLGGGGDHFCYPFGDCNAAVAAAVRACGYRSAVTTRPGRFDPGADGFTIPRENLDMVTLTDAATAARVIDACLDGSFSMYIAAKSRLRRWAGMATR